MTEMIPLMSPGESPFEFQGHQGQLEGIASIPLTPNSDYLAILGHPHSLHGGTMNNKVVTTLARAFKAANISCLRFNFRGVGKSQGCYDQGIGESLDLLALMDLCLSQGFKGQIILAGFSFGSYVTYRAACLREVACLISIAPAVSHYNYAEFSKVPSSWFILQGDQDEIVAIDEVKAFVEGVNPKPQFECFTDAGHFFHGKLILLRDSLMKIILAQVHLS